ncbi:GGDEF domain-containing protein [Companilactobacillus futsaii]|uniref:GGDEF domain-containing protein n=1 Tax=Companilactobacillus futsaii TaxID=938155 RepID=A0A5B7SUM8_9LACO|nr:GGDEF domain-containing protein [Companilactobacillus futsaii]
MLASYVVQFAPLLISLFFILGVFVFYEILFDGVRLLLYKRQIDISTDILRPWLGVLYIFLLLISFQVIISHTPTNWLFINFQITALVFLAILLNVPIKYHIFIPIILIFMIFNSAIYYWESWCFSITLIIFYGSLKYIKKQIPDSFPFSYYAVDILIFGFILWSLAKIKFSLSAITVLKQLTYMIFFTIFALGYISLITRENGLKKKLFSLASHDELTHSKNYTIFEIELKHQFKNSIQNQKPLTMAMFDIDHFKLVNDTFGHLAGDKVLATVVDIVQTIINENDPTISLYRTGGEEFNIIFPGYSINKTDTFINQVRLAINHTTIIYNQETEQQQIDITISIGISEVNQDDLNSQMFYDRVDQAMYQSKRDGRNRITKK